MFLGSSALNWRYIAVNKLLLGFSIFSIASKHREDLFSSRFLDMGVFLHLILLSVALLLEQALSCPDGRFQTCLVDKKLLFFSSKIFSYAIYYLKTGNANP